MANKTFVVQFGGGTGITGLNPTFIVFNSLPANGGTVWGATTPPGITEIPTTTGLYYFNYTPSAPVMFVIDGATTSLSLQSRYVAGNLDPIQQIDVQVAALGNTLVALGTSANAFGASLFATLGGLGTLADSFGSTLTDPTSVFGYLKRMQEWNEGDSSFVKQSGQWQVTSRGNTFILGATTFAGTSAILANKTITDSGSIISKG